MFLTHTRFCAATLAFRLPLVPCCQVRGHLEALAAILASPAPGDHAEERAFVQAWVDAAYEQARPRADEAGAGASEPLAKRHAAELIKAFAKATGESGECAGLPDFASLVAGGRVAGASKTFGESSGAWFNPFATATKGARPPEVALSPGASQGECWPMAGGGGALSVHLANDLDPAMPISFTLMHIHPKLAPKGDTTSAPKDFKVLVERAGTGGRLEKVEVASGVFDQDAGCMTFPADAEALAPLAKADHGADDDAAGDNDDDAAEAAAAAPMAVRRVTLEVLSNHGRPELTCLYRFMVHGTPLQPGAHPEAA